MALNLRRVATLELRQEQRAELEKVARSRRTPQAVVQRARIVLMTAEGVSPGAIGESAKSRTAWRACTTSLGQVARERWTISEWPIC